MLHDILIVNAHESMLKNSPLSYNLSKLLRIWFPSQVALPLA
ncbi:Uncharacterised protein [Legionella pneumophila]|nr:hypothetical protein PGH46_06395 [Legionella pneumophila]CZG49166.1 Uncharacterised protein [Legionella pneumophila]CZG65450.1 Uncharacterised protein [Legionella pneumophila]CZG67211.1 Uncharacterised protein [Legionella pneumophila]CZG74509.1 Uncharacterised protein [Legionella pneumophila]